jgi:hypothetical protein
LDEGNLAKTGHTRRKTQDESLTCFLAKVYLLQVYRYKKENKDLCLYNLVGGFNPAEKYEFVSWDDYS